MEAPEVQAAPNDVQQGGAKTPFRAILLERPLARAPKVTRLSESTAIRVRGDVEERRRANVPRERPPPAR